MNFFDKLSFKIYSVIMLLISIIFGITLTNIISISDIGELIENFVSEYFWATLVITLGLMIWSIRNIIYGGSTKRDFIHRQAQGKKAGRV